MVADNMLNCVDLLASGGCDFVLSYVHAEVRDALDARRFAALALGTDTLVAVVAPDQRAGLLKALGNGEALPLLSYASDTCLGQLVALVRARRPELTFDLRYENSMAEGLKTMALTGAGMAWLPVSSITRELAAGSLEAVGDASWNIDMQVTLHRRIEILREPAEKLWTTVSQSIR
jgi:DNA-binding transcriptional LysR family regulator